MPKVNVMLGDKLFSFSNEQQWINKARLWFERSGVKKGNYICIDSVGRVCTKGAEFMRATEEDTYPIIVYKLLV